LLGAESGETGASLHEYSGVSVFSHHTNGDGQTGRDDSEKHLIERQ
jgi:hypothetical protein